MKGRTSSSIFDQIDRHNYTQLSGKQLNQKINRIQQNGAPSCRALESCKLQMKLETSISETLSGILYLIRSLLSDFPSLLIHTKYSIQTCIAINSTHNFMKSYGISNAIYRESMNPEEKHEESSFAKQAQYDDVRKCHAFKSHTENNMEESNVISVLIVNVLYIH
ncbi:hypothetical protein NPIL_129431 [Nephila pilipes]|uniref:Uncharacterized protein n=1 Tax=Nephila pilipes TaxID=299642 RepID=A0A8X6QZW7_NEPPI|nr:hypothetical protein NPIL_161191 [Nephila pilipes]GFU45670.1 hypothetical protein NPIL_129431 [Nephila pilipes]